MDFENEEDNEVLEEETEEEANQEEEIDLEKTHQIDIVYDPAKLKDLGVIKE